MVLTLPRASLPLRAMDPLVVSSQTGVTAAIAATVRIAMDAAVGAVASADGDVAVSRVMARASRAVIGETAEIAVRVETEEIAATVRSTSPATHHRQLSRWLMERPAGGTTRRATQDLFAAPNTAT